MALEFDSELSGDVEATITNFADEGLLSSSEFSQNQDIRNYLLPKISQIPQKIRFFKADAKI